MARPDPAEVKRRLSDPREVARMLGLRVVARQARGVTCRCPIGGGDDPSLSLSVGRDGTLRAYCFGGCVSGDVLSLLAAIEGSFRAGLERGAALAGGAASRDFKPENMQEAPRLPAELYAVLAERICEEGRLDGRGAVRDVERYLDGRGLLEQARGDGWAALPSMRRALDIAREVWEGHAVRRSPARDTRPQGAGKGARGQTDDEPPGYHTGGFVFKGPGSVLVAAGLARWRERKLEPLWGGHRLLMPWRGPDGRIHALQRRHLRPRWLRGDGSEYPRYVAPWGLIWPYGVERLARASQACEYGAALDPEVNTRGDHHETLNPRPVESMMRPAEPSFRGALAFRTVAIVEGAVDTLALRALYPRLLVVGLPGLGGWEPSWARLFAGRPVRIALDQGMPGPDGVVPEDRVAARIALDIAGRPEDAERVARLKAPPPCVICGAAELWLCGACGRRRAPEGQDWGTMWEERVRARRA